MPKTSFRTKTIQMTDFTERVMHFVRQIPKGRVATYKQIAELAGKPGGSRGVGWILNSCAKPYKLPWQRVINSKGKISFDPRTKEHCLQKKLLLQEKVRFSEDGSIDIDVYGWKKKIKAAKKDRNRPSLFS